MSRLFHPPPTAQPDGEFFRLTDWCARIANQLVPIYIATKVIDPASVTANSTSTQSFTFGGITSEHVCILQKPTRTAGLNIVQVWVENDDVLSVAFENTTGGNIDPGSETYRLIGFHV